MRWRSFATFVQRYVQGLQCTGDDDGSGFRHNGPRLVTSSGRLIIASGPALCSPLKGVGLLTSKPQSFASLGLLNQKPTWNVLVGSRPTSGSKPKIWSSRMV